MKKLINICYTLIQGALAQLGAHHTGSANSHSYSQSRLGKNKYFQRYIEDQTYMKSVEIISKSSVTAFVERFYEKHPIDDSVEGVIARYSGMTSEQVDELMGTVEYVAFVSQYSPEDLYPLPADGTEEVAIFFDNEFWQENTNYYVIRNENIFWKKEDYVTI